MVNVQPRNSSPSNENSCAVVFMEANPFASRLHVLESLVLGVPKECLVTVVAPDRRAGPDLHTFEGSLSQCDSHVDVAVVGKKSDEHRITAPLLIRLLLRCRGVLRFHAHGTLVLTAIDDYFSFLPFLAPILRIFFPNARFIVIRYRVSDLFINSPSSLKQKCKDICLSVLERIIKPETVIFDERVQLTDRRHFIPDPWSGPFGELNRSEARRLLGWEDLDDVVLLVGRQDERKGFDVAAAALADINMRPKVKVVLIGGVAPSLVESLEELIISYGERFSHVTEYLSDDDISVYFAAASCVLLPYNSAFTSTSGVLVRAAASSTPVVASNHGLVGWRTSVYRLGKTFSYPRHADLAKQLIEVLDSPFDPSGATAFAQASTKHAVAQAFRRVLDA